MVQGIEIIFLDGNSLTQKYKSFFSIRLLSLSLFIAVSAAMGVKGIVISTWEGKSQMHFLFRRPIDLLPACGIAAAEYGNQGLFLRTELADRGWLRRHFFGNSFLRRSLLCLFWVGEHLNHLTQWDFKNRSQSCHPLKIRLSLSTLMERVCRAVYIEGLSHRFLCESTVGSQFFEDITRGFALHKNHPL